jgi:hypothetical protein
MICFVKPVLTEDLYIMQKEEISTICVILTLDERLSTFMRENPIFFSQRMLHKHYDGKGSVEKNLWS